MDLGSPTNPPALGVGVHPAATKKRRLVVRSVGGQLVTPYDEALGNFAQLST